jgi:hypothetical protein
MIDLQTKSIKLKKKNETCDLIKYFPFWDFWQCYLFYSLVKDNACREGSVLFLFEEKIQRPFPPNNMQAVVFTTQSSTIKPKKKRISRQDNAAIIYEWSPSGYIKIMCSCLSTSITHASGPHSPLKLKKPQFHLPCITLLSIKLTTSSSLINH